MCSEPLGTRPWSSVTMARCLPSARIPTGVSELGTYEALYSHARSMFYARKVFEFNTLIIDSGKLLTSGPSSLTVYMYYTLKTFYHLKHNYTYIYMRAYQ